MQSMDESSDSDASCSGCSESDPEATGQSAQPSDKPSRQPAARPTGQPSRQPTGRSVWHRFELLDGGQGGSGGSGGGVHLDVESEAGVGGHGGGVTRKGKFPGLLSRRNRGGIYQGQDRGGDGGGGGSLETGRGGAGGNAGAGKGGNGGNGGAGGDGAGRACARPQSVYVHVHCVSVRRLVVILLSRAVGCGL